VHHKCDTIAKVLETSLLNVALRRDLSGQRCVSWNALLLHLANIHLQIVHDEFRWNLHGSGKYLVASMYNALIHPDLSIDKINNNMLWKLKIPLRIKAFGVRVYGLGYLRKGVTLTKDNLAKRNWHGSGKCVLCHQDEIIKHLFFQYHFARYIWSVIQVASTLFLPRRITNIFGNWLNGIDHRFKTHIKV
jgi:hypothetical protein